MYVARKVFDRARRQDLAQEVLLSLHLARNSFDCSREFLPWLRSIVHHRIVDYFRSSKRRGIFFDENSSDTLTAENREGGVHYSGAAEVSAAFSEAVAALAEPQRKLLKLLTDSELSQDDIAMKLSISQGNLRVQIHRLSCRLRGVLE